MADVVQHLCRWLEALIEYVPADHPRSQGTVKRLEGWLHEVLSELCIAWPLHWYEYIVPACCSHRTTPGSRSNTKATPFSRLFGKAARTKLDALTPGIDGVVFRDAPDNGPANRQHAFSELRGDMKKIKKQKKNTRQLHDAAIAWSAIRERKK